MRGSLRITLEEVGAETCDITDVVAYVIGDGGGVTRVILGDVRFCLTDEVGAHIGSLGVDTAADTVEHGDYRATEGITGYGH